MANRVSLGGSIIYNDLTKDGQVVWIVMSSRGRSDTFQIHLNTESNVTSLGQATDN